VVFKQCKGCHNWPPNHCSQKTRYPPPNKGSAPLLRKRSPVWTDWQTTNPTKLTKEFRFLRALCSHHFSWAMISLHPFIVFCDWWFENNALAIESKGRKKQKWKLAIILLQTYFHIHLSLNSKQNAFIALQTRDFYKKIKGKISPLWWLFFWKMEKKEKVLCFLGYPNHQIFRNFKKKIQIFCIMFPSKANNFTFNFLFVARFALIVLWVVATSATLQILKHKGKKTKN
jgi:hypothetical protein